MSQRTYLLALIREAVLEGLAFDPHALDGEEFLSADYVGEKDFNFQKRVDYLRDHGIRRIGVGESRWVFDMGGGKVLKLELPPEQNDFFGQNQAEATLSSCVSKFGVFAKVLSHSDDYSWIVQEKADKVFPNENLFVMYLNDVLGLTDRLVLKRYSDIVDMLGMSKLPPSTWAHSKAGAISGDHMEAVKDNKWWKAFVATMKRCPDVNPEDLHDGNWGIKNGRLVVVDYGFVGDGGS